MGRSQSPHKTGSHAPQYTVPHPLSGQTVHPILGQYWRVIGWAIPDKAKEPKLACCIKFKETESVQSWIGGSFYKTTCKAKCEGVQASRTTSSCQSPPSIIARLPSPSNPEKSGPSHSNFTSYTNRPQPVTNPTIIFTFATSKKKSTISNSHPATQIHSKRPLNFERKTPAPALSRLGTIAFILYRGRRPPSQYPPHLRG